MLAAIGTGGWLLWGGLAAFFFVLYLGVYIWMRRPKFGEGPDGDSHPAPRAASPSTSKRPGGAAPPAPPPAAGAGEEVLIIEALFDAVLGDPAASRDVRADAEAGCQALRSDDRRGAGRAATRLLAQLRTFPRENGLRSLAEQRGVAAAALALQEGPPGPTPSRRPDDPG